MCLTLTDFQLSRELPEDPGVALIIEIAMIASVDESNDLVASVLDLTVQLQDVIWP